MKNTNIICKSVLFIFILTLLVSPELLAGEKKKADKALSPTFFAFDDAEYYTSPDKRIGAKILVDPTKVGPSISSMVHLTYLPGAHIDSHRHVFVTEVVYVLEGNLTLRIDEEIKIMGPNSTAYIPAKSFHEYLNDSTDVVKFLQYYSPSGPEEEYRNWTKPVEEAAAKTDDNQTTPQTDKPAHVIAPTAPVVPGSPQAVIGTVTDKSQQTNKNTTETQSTPKRGN
ncbi:MAG: cupin domain-containing protein [Candidatus Riflebacteria bacterium]|nr:cupin domain-containing protein [Candidatus Riflebacteria bacterium]